MARTNVNQAGVEITNSVKTPTKVFLESQGFTGEDLRFMEISKDKKSKWDYCWKIANQEILGICSAEVAKLVDKYLPDDLDTLIEKTAIHEFTIVDDPSQKRFWMELNGEAKIEDKHNKLMAKLRAKHSRKGKSK